MKKPYFILVVLLAAACTLLSSCSKSDKTDPSPTITAPVGKIDAKIAGTSFEAPGAAQITGNEIILGGVLNSQSISIVITKAAAVGTYDVKGAAVGTTPDAEVNYASDQSTLYSSTFATSGTSVGTVTITEIDETNKTISGTFSSTVVLLNVGTSVSLTEGSFNKIPYVTQAANSMTAKIDGNIFTAGVTVGASQSGYLIVNGQTINGGQILLLTMNSDITAGTYDIGDAFSQINGSYTIVAESAYYTSSAGTLTITKNDTVLKRIEGTFSFTSVSFVDEGDGPPVTEGVFSTSY